MAVLPDGTVLVAYREDCLATVWLSYDEGRTWQLQVDTSNLPVGNYLATVIDLQNKIPAFGVNFSLQ